MSGWRVGLLALLCAMALPAEASASRVGLSYHLFAGGLHALDAEVTVHAAPPDYRVTADLVTKGFIDFLIRWRSRQQSVGVLRDGKARPQLHTRDGEWRLQNRSARLVYDAAGNVVVTIEPPPEDDGRTEVTPEQRRGAIDLLSLVAQGAMAPGPAAACSGTAEIFDGRRRYDVILTPGGEETLKPQEYGFFAGRALRCRVEIKPIAGFRPDTDEESGLGLPTGISVWLVQDPAVGLVLPVRFEGDIPFGRLIGHLTRITAPDD